ncbi:MAG TPA: methyltransferase domain-containing protein [Candidatus Sulfotelmatobacter sp.]|nr:methyltransferase domain-containing protein [Candidatus Sulfotelmatobacter sp.]
MAFSNCYEDARRAEAYAQLEFANTYYLAYRDLPEIIGAHVVGKKAIDFGCGTGRSTRFLRKLGFETIGIDIAPEMLAKAKQVDPSGDYRLVKDDDFRALESGAFDLVLSVFTFDNVSGFLTKMRLFQDLAALMNATGKLISVVSSPEIYLHEWTSFSTKNYPENRTARSGDIVRIVTTDFADQRPAEDILCTDESYREIYGRSGLTLVECHRPLGRTDEPYKWVSETSIAPWVIYVLGRSGGE